MIKIKELVKSLSPKYQTINLEYPVDAKPKFGEGSRIHTHITEILNSSEEIFADHLKFALSLKSEIQSIRKAEEEVDKNKPGWNNGFLPGLDIIMLFAMMIKHRPAKYIEIGSGNSTKVVKKAIEEKELKTEITSIDPFPRAEIDALSDTIIRKPLETLNDYNFILDELDENDILFIDNSHRVLPNSDASVCFLELFPFLKKGVIVHIHDIYIPYDYPQFMCDRFYNEQYMLTAFLTSNPERYTPIMPNYFVSETERLSKLIAPIWNHPNLKGVEQHGGSFWLRIGE